MILILDIQVTACCLIESSCLNLFDISWELSSGVSRGVSGGAYTRQ